jgi:hypothetical protein
MIRKTIYILTLFLGIVITDAAAQNSQVLYYMNLPQKHLLNPALRPSNSLYIGLPGISGINLNVNNNFVNFSDVFMKGQTGDSLITFLHPDNDINSFLSKIKNKNSFEPEVLVQLFGLGFNVGKTGYLFLDINERADGNIVIPGDLFELLLKGNEDFVGKKMDLSSLRGNVNYYHEIGLGYSKNFTNKLRIGVKGKLLLGVAGISIDNRSLGITVNDNYTHTLDADVRVNISAPATVSVVDGKLNSIDFNKTIFDTKKGITDFLLNGKNMGFGLDLGASYDISDKFMVSAALTDIGFIRWKKDVTSLVSDSRFEFSGLNLVDVLKGTMTFDSLANNMLDSLKNAFTVSEINSPFTTWLPFGVTIGGSYNLSKKFSVGILSYSRFIGKQVRESLTLSANVNLNNAFSTSVSYTASNHRFDNLGAGLSFRAGVFQFYVLADRIPVTWNKIKADSNPILIPSNWNTINLRLGMNLAFGNKLKKKNDKPMVPVE